MTQNILTNLGEEYWNKNSLGGTSITVGLYDDSTDALSDTSDIGGVSTEPSSTNYARASDTVSVRKENSNWGVENDTSFSFDFSDVASGDAEDTPVDTAFVVINFAAEETSDGGTATDHLVANAALSQSYNTGDVDSIDVAAGDLDINLD